MKALILSTILIGSFAQANPECFDFDVRKNSSDLTVVRVSILKDKKKTKATVTGTTGDKTISNDFDCKEVGAKVTCEHPIGAGDFTLQMGNEATLKFSYVNLAIGGKGPNAPKPGDEITEEFAFLDKSPAANDDEEDAVDLGEVTLTGKKVSCDTKIKGL